MTDATSGVEATPPSRRRPRASAGGFTLKLDAEQRPGYVRRFVNATPTRIAKMEALGYAMASDQAGEGKTRTHGKGSRITRLAGTLESGAPMQAVLMETPAHEYAYGEADREDSRKAVEDVIRRSGDPTGQLENAYVPDVRSSLEHKG